MCDWTAESLWSFSEPPSLRWSDVARRRSARPGRHVDRGGTSRSEGLFILFLLENTTFGEVKIFFGGHNFRTEKIESQSSEDLYFGLNAVDHVRAAYPIATLLLEWHQDN